MSELVQDDATAALAADDFAGAVHASCVAIAGCAVLIGGPSGAGKSDLALRLIDRGATLVSDDYTHVAREGAAVIANPAPNIEGQIEVRGVGIVPLPCVRDLPVGLVVIGMAVSGIERMPEEQSLILCGTRIPLLRLSLLEASAPIKVEMALKHLKCRISEGIAE